MKAIIKNQVSNAVNYGGQKELVSTWNVIGKIKGELKTVVTARCYMGRSRSASTVYASVWIHGDDIYTSGHGSAGGYGYHKESAAIDDAITSAGIELYGSAYADKDGMVRDSIPNPNFSQQEMDKAYEISAAEGNKYLHANPRSLYVRVKEKTKNRTNISGVGSAAIECALLAIAKSAGAKGKLLITTN
jgi:hypothetical protein